MHMAVFGDDGVGVCCVPNPPNPLFHDGLQGRIHLVEFVVHLIYIIPYVIANTRSRW